MFKITAAKKSNNVGTNADWGYTSILGRMVLGKGILGNKYPKEDISKTLVTTPRNFTIQQIFEFLLQKPSDKSIIGYLKYCKTSNFESTSEMTFPSGGRGDMYIGRGFSHSKRVSLNVESAVWNTHIIASQNGADIISGETNYNKYVQIEIKRGIEKYNLPFKPIKETGQSLYIGTVYATRSNGDYVMSLKEDSAVSSGEFTVTVSKDDSSSYITFDQDDINKMIDILGAIKLSMVYTVTSSESAQRIDIKANTIPKTALVTAYGLVADICDGSLYPCIIHGMVQIGGNWTLELAADGDPAVQNLSMQFITSCSSNDLCSIVIDTSEE